MFVVLAEWDYQNQSIDSTTPFPTKKEADSSNHRLNNHISPKQTQVRFIFLFVLIERVKLTIRDLSCNKLGHSSPGGDLSDEEICTRTSTISAGPLGLESLCIAGSHMEFSQQPPHHTRSRSGSCTSRRSQFRLVFLSMIAEPVNKLLAIYFYLFIF